MRPLTNEYAPYYDTYISKAPETDIVEALRNAHYDMMSVINGLSDEQAAHRYAPEKWSIKDILQHLIDSERVFAYRALSISRGCTDNLPGYDHDAYVVQARADYRKMKSLLTELERVRAASVTMFETFSADMLAAQGKAADNEITVRSLGFIIAGHQQHHLAVIKERYL